jgi:amidase
MVSVHAFGDDALMDDDAVGLAARLRAREVSAAELVEAAIARTEKVNGALNGIACPDFDRARTWARHPNDGYFGGVPTLIKDNTDQEGLPTQHGSDAFVARPKKGDAPVVALAKAMGLTVLGKTQLSEFGLSPTAEHPRLGAVRTPWDTDHVAGASSAGSGALVAAGAVPLAHGNDGGGSIRIPASVNGLVGLKATRGRVPGILQYRMMPVRIVHEGVLTRSVRDTAAFLREVERRAPLRGARPVGDVTGPGTRRLRVAMVTTSPATTLSPEAVTLTQRTAALLEGLGHKVEEVPPMFGANLADDFILYWGFLARLLTGMGRSLGDRWDVSRTDPLTRNWAENFSRHKTRLPGAVRRLRGIGAVLEEFHRTYDVLLMPTLGHATPAVGHLDPTQPHEQYLERVLRWVVYTPITNASGHPSLSLPLTRTADGLPFGMMFSAALGQEALLLELAYELEQAQPFARIQDV